MRKNIIITSLILLFSIIIFGNKTNDVRIKKYNPILKYSLVSPWFEYIPSNSKIGVISTALDQLGIKKFVFKTLYNLHTKNINLDYNYVNQINRSHKQYINIWQNENKEHILNTTYYPKYTGFELLNSISVGWNNYFTTGINYLKTDKSEGVLNLYKGERYNLILRLSNTEYEYSSDYPVIIKDIDVQSLTFIKDLKDDGISEFKYVRSKSLFEKKGFQIKATGSYNRLSNITVYDPLILLRPQNSNHVRGFNKEVYADRMIKGSLDIKKRLYRDFSFKIGHSYSLTLYGGFFFDHLDATLGKASRSYSTYGFSFQIASLLLGKIPYNLSFYILKDEDRETEHFSNINISLLRF